MTWQTEMHLNTTAAEVLKERIFIRAAMTAKLRVKVELTHFINTRSSTIMTTLDFHWPLDTLPRYFENWLQNKIPFHCNHKVGAKRKESV